MEHLADLLDITLSEALESKRYKYMIDIFDGDLISSGDNGNVTNLRISKSDERDGDTVNDWAKAHSGAINFLALDASALKATVVKVGVKRRSYLFSESDFDILSKPDTVLCVKNAEKAEGDAAALLNDLIERRRLTDPRDPRTPKTLNNILFTIICSA